MEFKQINMKVEKPLTDMVDKRIKELSEELIDNINLTDYLKNLMRKDLSLRNVILYPRTEINNVNGLTDSKRLGEE